MKSKRLIAIISITTLLISFSACSDSKKTENSTLSNSVEDLGDIISKDVESSISELQTEYEQLKDNIDTYDKYVENKDKIEAFYSTIYNANNELCIKMYEYSLKYAELIVQSDKSNDDKYDDLDELYDNIYDDARDDIYDGIYDGVLDDIYDDFYNGVLDDSPEDVPYDKWSDIISDEYDMWSDTRSDVYDVWYDCGSDIYDFWSDLRSDIWDDDIEKAVKTIEDFREDIEKLKGNSAADESKTAKSDKSFETDKSSESDDDTSDNGIDPEFKATMDSFESFFNDYTDFMEKYDNADYDDLPELMSDYTSYMTKYSETMEKINDIHKDELSAEELAYYIEITSRINAKLFEVS